VGVNRVIGVDETAIIQYARQLIEDNATWCAVQGYRIKTETGDVRGNGRPKQPGNVFG
jgi:hypothetical protein